MATKMFAPGSQASFNCSSRSGTQYTSNSAGLITVTDPNDIRDLINMGCTVATNAAAVAGASSQVVAEDGMIGHSFSAAGVGNAAATTDTVLAVFALPANAFDTAGRALEIVAAGATGATDNDKQIKLWASTSAQVVGSAIVATGSTVIADSGVLATKNDLAWRAVVEVAKYGAAASNTQLAYNGEVAVDTVSAGVHKPVALTKPENGIIYFAVTGASPTTGAASDVLLNVATAKFSN